MSPEVIVEAAGPLGDAPSRPIKAFYNLCGYDPSEESPILLSWIGDFFLSGGLPKMATCSESKQFTVCSSAHRFLIPVGSCGINQAVAGPDGVVDNLLALCLIRDLVDTESLGRHLYSVV